MRIKSILFGLSTFATIAAGIALIAFSFLDQASPAKSSHTSVTNDQRPQGFNVPKVGASEREPRTSGVVSGPKDKTLTVTVPDMARIEDDRVPDALGTDKQKLRNNAAIHLEGTGFPWQEEANVYLAGHRLGYPSTDSFLAFWDLNKLEKGDKIFVTDSKGRKYTYKVYREFVTKPTDLSVTKPLPGKNILTLQTCTLPDYSQRLITQARLVKAS